MTIVSEIVGVILLVLMAGMLWIARPAADGTPAPFLKNYWIENIYALVILMLLCGAVAGILYGVLA